MIFFFFFFSSRRRHTRLQGDWSSDVCSSDLGRFDVVTVGTQRFRLLGLDHSRPYLQGEIELLAEETGDEAAAALAVPALQRSFRDYLDALATQGAARIDVPDLPDEPVLLSYL